MGKVKNALEIAMEKAAKLGNLSDEEKETIQDEAIVTSILKDFYQGKLDSDTLWERLKGNKPRVLTMAQINLIDSLGLGSTQEEIHSRMRGIIAIETLKRSPNTALIESGLRSIESLQREYQEAKEQAITDLTSQIERNPQLRMKPVNMPNGRTVMQMAVSVDEAVKNRLSDFLAEHETQYNQAFAEITEELKEVVMSV